jgi:hypothetical protein
MARSPTMPCTRHAVAHLVLRLAALVAAAMALPRVLERLGLRDVSWAPPAETLSAPAEDP